MSLNYEQFGAYIVQVYRKIRGEVPLDFEQLKEDAVRLQKIRGVYPMKFKQFGSVSLGLEKLDEYVIRL